MTRSPATRDLAAALAGLGRCGLKEHTLGLAPESLSWGRGALAVVCPAPKGAGLRFWLAPLGTEKKEGRERGGDQGGVGDRGGTREIWNAFVLGCLCRRCLCWRGLGLLGRGVCFGEIHLQDVPL